MLSRPESEYRGVSTVDGVGLPLFAAVPGTGLNDLPPHDLQNSLAELGQIVGLAAGDEVPIDDDGRIEPNRTGIDQIVLDSRRTSDFHPFVNACRDGDPAAVADGRDQF